MLRVCTGTWALGGRDDGFFVVAAVVAPADGAARAPGALQPQRLEELGVLPLQRDPLAAFEDNPVRAGWISAMLLKMVTPSGSRVMHLTHRA